MHKESKPAYQGNSVLVTAERAVAGQDVRNQNIRGKDKCTDTLMT